MNFKLYLFKPISAGGGGEIAPILVFWFCLKTAKFRLFLNILFLNLSKNLKFFDDFLKVQVYCLKLAVEIFIHF